MLTLSEPEGIVAQAVTSYSVRFSEPSPNVACRVVKIRCGDTVIAEMPDVHPME